MSIINYHNITYPDQNNGDGLRVVLWLSGCDHHCYNCQNPITWDVNGGLLFDEKAKEELFRELDKDYISGLTLTGGDPLHPSNLDGVLDIVNEFNKRYRTTQDMVSNEDNDHNMLNENVNKIRLLIPEKTIWLYTGYTINFYEVYNSDHTEIEVLPKDNIAKNDLKRLEIVSKCDVLVDGRYIDSQRNLSKKWCGSNNQRVINVQESLKQNKIILYCD